MSIILKPGIYDDLSSDDYHGANGISSSTLKEMARSAAHCKAKRDGDRALSTAATNIGIVLHTAVLEPEVFVRQYAKKPTVAGFPDALVSLDDYKACAKKLKLPVSGTKDALKQRIQEADSSVLFFDDVIAEQTQNKTVLNDGDWELCDGVVKAIGMHEKARKALSNGVAERSVVWDDPITQELCKARFDYYREDLGIIFDLKTCVDARQWQATRAIEKYKYHVSAAMYLEGARANGLKANGFAWLFVEKEAPYAVGLYMASAAMVSKGAEQFRTWLNQYHDCQQSGIWPCYPSEFTTIELPEWAA